MPKDLELFQNILAYELVRRALLTRAILAFFPPNHHHHPPDKTPELLISLS